MPYKLDLSDHGIYVDTVLRNVSPAKLYEEALKREKDSAITNRGALAVTSGEKTGRSPKDKRIVVHPDSQNDIDWGAVNIKLDDHTFLINHERAVDFLNTQEQIYVVDGFAGWDPKYRLKVRIICSRAYHALFMHNMLIRPTTRELKAFGSPDFTIYNSGKFPANRYTSQMTSSTSIDLSFERNKMVILGTEYAGEMKKGIFTVLNYLMPKQGVLSMHCSANEGADRDVTLLFGLSGTGKTTLSADPKRRLIGDDEHCWSDDGVFNIEGGCYAKCIQLSAKKEPDIFQAIRFGTVLENVTFSRGARKVNFADDSLTENTRASYPIDYIENAKIPCVGDHARNIIFLTCDAFGILPPVSKLDSNQAMYHFISGYTAKIAGTEIGITEPQATFSACFGEAFMVWHPTKYAELLAAKMQLHGTQAWLVNTGWTGGGYGKGDRISLTYTRAIVDAIHDNSLEASVYEEDPIFRFSVCMSCPGVPSELLNPRESWSDENAYDCSARELAALFVDNFNRYEKQCPAELTAAGPKPR